MGAEIALLPGGEGLVDSVTRSPWRPIRPAPVIPVARLEEIARAEPSLTVLELTLRVSAAG